MSEVEKIMDLVSDLVLDKPGLIVQNTIKVSAAVEALAAERDGWKEQAEQYCELCNEAKVLIEAKAQVQQEALFLLHTGKFYDGEQDEWEIEADSSTTVSAFCHAHPAQTIGLYAAPVNCDKLREAVQKALELARDGAIESLIEVLEALK